MKRLALEVVVGKAANDPKPRPGPVTLLAIPLTVHRCFLDEPGGGRATPHCARPAWGWMWPKLETEKATPVINHARPDGKLRNTRYPAAMPAARFNTAPSFGYLGLVLRIPLLFAGFCCRESGSRKPCPWTKSRPSGQRRAHRRPRHPRHLGVNGLGQDQGPGNRRAARRRARSTPHLAGHQTERPSPSMCPIPNAARRPVQGSPALQRPVEQPELRQAAARSSPRTWQYINASPVK